jgi:alkylation response protein AidB-like acyl-CoA dehydrogenase
MTVNRLPIVAQAESVLSEYLPDLAIRLCAYGLGELESEGNPGISEFKTSGGPGLLIPTEYGGRGASAADIVQIQFALGHLSPSTAIAITMHQFTVGTFVEMLEAAPGMEWLVVEAVASQGLLVASGFAEGDPEGKVLRPSMTLAADGPGYRLNGAKKPCSLSTSMDMITVSVQTPSSPDEFAIVLLGRDTPGITVEPLWSNAVLAGAETGIVRFDNVSVPRSALSYVAGGDDLERTQLRGYTWFELCITSSYLGIAAILVEAALARATDSAIVEMAGELEPAIAMLDHVAHRLDAGEASDVLLARTLFVRFAVERAIQRATDRAFELLGVGTLSSDAPLTGLLMACRALSYHPPSRRRCEPGLASFVSGAALTLE